MKRYKVVYYKHNSPLKFYVIVSANNKGQAIQHCFSSCYVCGNREDLISVEEVKTQPVKA